MYKSVELDSLYMVAQAETTTDEPTAKRLRQVATSIEERDHDQETVEELRELAFWADDQSSVLEAAAEQVEQDLTHWRSRDQIPVGLPVTLEYVADQLEEV